MLPQYSPWNQPGMVGAWGAHMGAYGPEIMGGAGPEIFGAASPLLLAAAAQAAQQAPMHLNPAALQLRAPLQMHPAGLAMPQQPNMLALIHAQEAVNQNQQREINALYAELHRLQKGITSRPVLGTDMRVDAGGAILPRELPVPIDSGPVLIPAGATVNVNISPQATFRVERLAVADSLGTTFTISDLKVGKDSQFVAAGTFSAELFSNKSVGVGLKGDSAVPGILISVTVTNVSGAAARFLGMIIGFTGLNQ